MENNWRRQLACIRIRNPRCFFFCLWRLVQTNLRRRFSFSEILGFFETNKNGLKLFISNKQPRYLWLNKAANMQGGKELLEMFDIECLDQESMECLEPDWKSEHNETPEVRWDPSGGNTDAFKEKESKAIEARKLLSKKEKLLMHTFDDLAELEDDDLGEDFEDLFEPEYEPDSKSIMNEEAFLREEGLLEEDLDEKLLENIRASFSNNKSKKLFLSEPKNKALFFLYLR